MKKTLLLCFIHGFKGGDDTFGAKSEFAQHLAALLSAELPRLEVRAITYPKYETRGDLQECVGRFREWLLEQVIDIEVANGTASPTVDPSVRTVLVGHSMGGIVAADTAIAIAGEKVIKGSSQKKRTDESGQTIFDQDIEDNDGGDDEGDDMDLESLMFPYIQGVLAFDTPYLGISPGVVAHGAEEHYNTAAAALTQLSGLSGMFFGPGGKQQQRQAKDSDKSQEAQQETATSTKGAGWGRWGQVAMAAGAAGAIAAGGAAAYAGRSHIGQGWTWATSHLEFVNCLAKGEDLRRRVAGMVRLHQELDVGFANLYTRLGRTASSTTNKLTGAMLGSNQRTFCNLPSKQAAGEWREAVNDLAKDETGAHMAMFESEHNSGYSQLSEDAKNLIVSWARNDWYETSSFEIE